MSAMGFVAVGLGAAPGAWSRWLLGLLLNPLFVMFAPGDAGCQPAGRLSGWRGGWCVPSQFPACRQRSS